MYLMYVRILVAHVTGRSSFHLTFAVDFVLKDPRKKGEKADSPVEPHRLELLQVPKPWFKSVLAAYRDIEKSLLLTNPTLGAVLNLWYEDYRYILYAYTHSCIRTYVHMCAYVSMYALTYIYTCVRMYVDTVCRVSPKGGYQGAPPLYSLFCDNNFLLE